MACGMCEAHINDAIRAAFRVKKVSSSRKSGETVILSETPPDPDRLRQVISTAGYILFSVSGETVKKTSLLTRFMKR